MDISVIVPIFNASSVIHQCLGNLIHQTKKEIELILVDDASTDDTPAILESAKEEVGSRIRIITADKNGGPGVARNLGLEVATGEYIGFCDADDLVDPTMYEKLFCIAKENDADIADGAFYRASQNAANIHFSKELSGPLDDEKKSILMSAGGFVVTKIFKNTLLSDWHIRFRPSYGLEDMDFLMEAIFYAKNVVGIEEVLYNYRDSDGSLSKELQLEKYVTNHLDAIEGIYNRLSDAPNYAGVQEACEYAMLALYRNVVNQTILSKKEYGDAYCLEILEKAKDIRKRCIACRSRDNALFSKKYTKEDIAVLETNDRDPKKALYLI